MFNSKYGTPGETMMKKYDRICSIFLSKAKDEVTKKKMEQILYNGRYGNYLVNTDLTNKGNATLEMRRRVSIAYMLATNPETFDVLFQNNINLFHGTNISALPNILNYGMNSFNDLSKRGIDISTGENFSRQYNGRSFISFTDDLDTAIDYAAIMPSLGENQKDNSYGMLIGISSEDLKKLSTCRVHSDTPEIGIMNNVPLEYIKLIAVPENKVQFVRKLVGDKPITVAPVNIDDRFYYIDDCDFVIDDERAEEFIQEKRQRETIAFKNEDIKELASERKISGIKSIYKKIKEKIQSKGKEIEDESRE